MSRSLVRSRLIDLIAAVSAQKEIESLIPEDEMGFDDQIRQLNEWVGDANECEIAYELLVCLLEKYPFRLSGSGAVQLLELGLLFGYKTRRAQDACFDVKK